MSKTRLAMVAVAGTYEGPWSRIRGNERGIRVLGLGEGEAIQVEAVGSDPNLDTFDRLYCESGEFFLTLDGFNRYRVCKRANGGPTCPTTVEIILSEE